MGKFIVTLVLIWIASCVFFGGESEEEKQAREVQKARDARMEKLQRLKEEAERKRREYEQSPEFFQKQREDKLRTFAMKEAPCLWTTYQNLSEEVSAQSRKIAELEKTIREFGRDPEDDEDFKGIRQLSMEMCESRNRLMRKIEDAYLAAKKYEATPSRKEYDEQCRRILQDGIQEAELATRRFNFMRTIK